MAKKSSLKTPKPAELRHIVKELRPMAVRIDTLTRDPANTNIHDERNLSTIAASMKSCKVDQPLVVQKQGRIIRKGNGRHEAAERLGWTYMPAIVIDEGDIEAVLRSIADNQSSKLSRFDMVSLGRTLKALQDAPDVDETLTGLSSEEIGRIVARTHELALQGEDDDENGQSGEGSPGGFTGAGTDEAHVRMVSIYLDDRNTFPEFQRLVEKIGDAHGFDNATDVVLHSVREIGKGLPDDGTGKDDGA